MRRKTLLLCFIHGFKGNDDTFDGFPADLRALVSHAIPNMDVRTVVYPQYETRGDLPSCVAKFREWLQSRVLDLELSLSNPSPLADPSVRTVLVAHSMGGIVAADTLLSILDDTTITLPNGRQHRKTPGTMWPYIQGILAFDTPFLSLSPAVFAYGTDTKVRAASSTISQISAMASSLLASKAASEGKNVVQKQRDAEAATEAAARAAGSSRSSRSGSRSRSSSQIVQPPPAPAAPAGLWGGWGKVAAYAGAASLIAGAGAIAYFQRESLSLGLGWVSSHLEFVGALTKMDELRKRTERASSVRGVGFANLYTALAEKGQERGDRTFCTLPLPDGPENERLGKLFKRCVNGKVADEVEAHVSMFSPKTNPWYPEMSQMARGLVVEWVGNWGGPKRTRGSPERSEGVGRGERL